MIRPWIPKIIKGRAYYSVRRSAMDCYFNNRLYAGAFDRTRSIYIHIPKAAGTSISQALYGYDPRHLDLWRYQVRDSNKFNDYYKFAFVRNPYTRLASAYFHILKKYNQINWLDKRSPFHVMKECRSFEDFVIDILPTKNIATTQFFKPQADFLKSKDGVSRLPIDFVGKFERINTDFNVVCDQLKLNIDLPHRNTGAANSYNGLFNSKEVRDRICSIYSDDFELFGYDREGYAY